MQSEETSFDPTKKKTKNAVFGAHEPSQKRVTVRLSDRHYKALQRFQAKNRAAYLSTAAGYLLERAIDEIEGTEAQPSTLKQIEGAQRALAQHAARIEKNLIAAMTQDIFNDLKQQTEKGLAKKPYSDAQLLSIAKKRALKRHQALCQNDPNTKTKGA